MQLLVSGSAGSVLSDRMALCHEQIALRHRSAAEAQQMRVGSATAGVAATPAGRDVRSQICGAALPSLRVQQATPPTAATTAMVVVATALCQSPQAKP